MKIKRNHVEIIIFIVVYLHALYLWTLPFQHNKIPYGEFDAISHWELADYFAEHDKTFLNLPAFVDFSYGENNEFRKHTLWYHPPFHTDLAAISSFAPERVVPVYFTNAVFASSIIISIFFVMRKLYGFLTAILSPFLLSFSMRDIMPYLWGQWPERFGYAFIPLILYFFYKYYLSYTEKDAKPIYLYMTAMLLGVQVMIHPLSFFHSLVGVFVLGIALLIKTRKFPFNLKHIGISIMIFLILFAIFPYQSGNVIKQFTKKSTSQQEKPGLGRLLQWAPDAKQFSGSVPPSYFSFREMHGLWTLPFLLLGLLIILIKRENRDIFLLAWLISLYIILHRDFIGKTTFLHRSLSATAHIFVPITVLGILSVASFAHYLNKNLGKAAKVIASVIFIALVMKYNIPQASSALKSAYDSPIVRLNLAQMEVSQWIKDKVPEDTNVSIIGPPPEIMQKVWWMASYSHRISHFFEGFLTWGRYKDKPEIAKYHLMNDYVVFDYSDIGIISDRSFVDKWAAFEQQNMQNHTLLYNKDNIKVYKYEHKA